MCRLGMAAAGLTRCAGLLLVLLVAVNGIGEDEFSNNQAPFFYEGTPAHVTTTPEPATETMTPSGGGGFTGTITPPPAAVAAEEAAQGALDAEGMTVTLTPGPGGLSNGAKIAIGVVGGTAAAAGLTLGGVLLHNSLSPKTVPTVPPIVNFTNNTVTLFPVQARTDTVAQEEEGSSASSGDSSATTSSDSSVPASASWLFWLLLLTLLCYCCALGGIAYFFLKKKKKNSRKVATRTEPAYQPGYTQAPATDTMPLISPTVAEAGPLTDSRVKLQPAVTEYAYTTTAAPAYTTTAAPITYATAAPTYTTAAPAATILQPANVTTVYASQFAQPTADFGTPITVAPMTPMTQARVIEGGIQ